MTEFIISSDQLERLIEAVEHNTGREINRLVIDSVRAREIVRCRDCEYFDTRKCESRWPFCLDAFCWWGKRKVDV